MILNQTTCEEATRKVLTRHITDNRPITQPIGLGVG